LEGIALDALVSHSQQELQAGNAEAALKVANRAIAVNSLREDAHRLIIQALAATGRKAEALKHYQYLVALLERELSTVPDTGIQSLVAKLRGARPPGTSRTSSEPHPDARGTSEWEADAATRDDDASNRAGVRSNSLEQRQLTIMVCNLIGPMPASAGLDPEDIHDLVAAFHKMVTDIAARFDGFVAQYQGYGALVYFGYPAAHEHDAERAVRAGLAILDSVGMLTASSSETIQASVGIATGLVVVGKKPATRRHRRDSRHGNAAPGRGGTGRSRYCRQHVAARGADVRLQRGCCRCSGGAAAFGEGVAGAWRGGRGEPV
jgi:class 3 adenylate cyclase